MTVAMGKPIISHAQNVDFVSAIGAGHDGLAYMARRAIAIRIPIEVQHLLIMAFLNARFVLTRHTFLRVNIVVYVYAEDVSHLELRVLVMMRMETLLAESRKNLGKNDICDDLNDLDDHEGRDNIYSRQ